jgi:putative Holliday junction resolvase
MPILEINEFKNLREQKRPILALDLGEKTIGVAISDNNWIIGSPLKTIEHKKFTTSAGEIFELIHSLNICGIVIGLPKNMDGSEGPKAQSHRQFARNLLKINDIAISFIDERASTMQAERILLEADMNYTKRKKLIDKMAASVILQSFIENL